MVSNNEWWSTECGYSDQMRRQSSQELPSEMIYQDFVANITDANLVALENEFRSSDLAFEKKPNNIITVLGRDRAVLNGERLLNALRTYDRNAYYSQD